MSPRELDRLSLAEWLAYVQGQVKKAGPPKHDPPSAADYHDMVARSASRRARGSEG